MDQVTNNKLVLMDIVGRIQEQHPGKGALIIVDELLDFIESHKDQQLRLDLAFMRELGEVCAQTAFRFIAGIQESLFDAPRFQFVADSVRRVKDRFEQVRIAREDLAFVVEARLLRKSPAQRDRIQAHLSRFAARYGGMSERMDRFVRLFPVHPDYLAIFEQISAIEKRQVLQSLTSELASVLDQTVPEDGPGLPSYDRFWGQIAENASPFAVQRPDYPSFIGFQRPISSQNREENVRAALQTIVGPIATQQGNAVLEALELLEGTNLRPRGSRYADYLSGLLTGRGEGQVVNRTELLQPVVDSQGNTLLEEETRFRIEPEWLLVVLAALVFKGELVLALPGGQRIDSSNLGESIRRPLRELLAFRHIERPRDLPLAALLELFQLLGLAEGLLSQSGVSFVGHE